MDDEFLKNNYLTMTNKEFAELYRVDNNKIKRRLSKLGLRREQFPYIKKEGEITIPIIGHEQYSITNTGIVVNNITNTVLKHKITNNGYSSVGLSYNNKIKWYFVHRLVALHFIENNDVMKKVQVNHLDGDKLNNNVLNLEWVTPKENQLHALENKLKIPVRGSSHGNSIVLEEQVIEICKLINDGYKTSEIVKMKDYATKSIVEKIKNKTRWTHLTNNYLQ